MDAEINLADISVLDHCLITGVGGIVRRDMVQRASGWESDARIESVGFNQVTGTVLDHFTNLDHGHAWLDRPPGVLPDLAMDLGGAAGVVVLVKVLFLQSALLLAGSSPEVTMQQVGKGKCLARVVLLPVLKI